MIKLPRKRKKAYIKKHGVGEYIANTIINEILYEESHDPKHRRYPEFVIVGSKLVVLYYW